MTAPLPGCLAVTLTPTRTPPEVSRTIPPISPVLNCAKASDVCSTHATTNNMNRIAEPPFLPIVLRYLGQDLPLVGDDLLLISFDLLLVGENLLLVRQDLFLVLGGRVGHWHTPRPSTYHESI